MRVCDNCDNVAWVNYVPLDNGKCICINCRIDEVCEEVESIKKHFSIDEELRKESPDVENIKKAIKQGDNIYYTNEKGHDYSYRAAMKGRYDIVDLLYRSQYTDI